ARLGRGSAGPGRKREVTGNDVVRGLTEDQGAIEQLRAEPGELRRRAHPADEIERIAAARDLSNDRRRFLDHEPGASAPDHAELRPVELDPARGDPAVEQRAAQEDAVRGHRPDGSAIWRGHLPGISIRVNAPHFTICTTPSPCHAPGAEPSRMK